VGANVTLIVHVAPAATAPEQVPAAEKFAGAVTPEICSGTD
jgi:hypothetical protein